MKETVAGDWCHLLCAIVIPEVRVLNTAYMEPIDGIDEIQSNRWQKVRLLLVIRKLSLQRQQCYLCSESEGSSVICSNRSCTKAFHVSCARDRGLALGWSAHEDHFVKGQTLCHTHSQAAVGNLECSQHGSNDSQVEEVGSRQKRRKIPRSRSIAIPKPKPVPASTRGPTRSFAFDRLPIVPAAIYSAVVAYIEPIEMDRKAEFVTLVCRYWSLKRESRGGASLMSQLHTEVRILYQSARLN